MTRRFEVKDEGLLVENYAQSCDSFQVLRELTVNSIEAILATSERRGTIVWTYDPDTFKQTGIRKLCCIDNGCGMDAEALQENVGKLSSTGSEKTQGLEQNFGMGAKIATITRNPIGVVYKSWRDGKGAMIKMCRDVDPKTGRAFFGLAEFNWKDQLDYQETYWPLEATDFKPAVIGVHGTQAILLGATPEQNTTVSPIDGRSEWRAKHLNARLFELPPGIDLWSDEPNAKDEWKRRQIRGTKYYLERDKIASGIVEIQTAVVHWWLLRSDAGCDPKRFKLPVLSAMKREETWGGWELFPYRGGGQERKGMVNFGVFAGANRVSLIVEPRGSERVYTDPMRMELKIGDAQKLPWETWGEEFAANLPEPLREYLNEFTSQSVSEEESIEEELEEYAFLIQPPIQYVPDESGTELLDRRKGEKITRIKKGGRRNTDKETEESDDDGYLDSNEDFDGEDSGFTPNSAIDSAIKARKEEHDSAVVVDVRFVLKTDFDEQAFAADYARLASGKQLVRVNMDNAIIKNIFDSLRQRFSHCVGHEAEIESVCKKFLKRHFIELVRTVLMNRKLKWHKNDANQMLTPGALTAALAGKVSLFKDMEAALRDLLKTKPLRCKNGK